MSDLAALPRSRLFGGGFFAYLRHGPWGNIVGKRLIEALQDLVIRISSLPLVVGIVVFGSYARGEAGASSDLDLLVLFDTEESPEQVPEGRSVLATCGEVEATHRLPVHLAPVLATVRRPEALGESLKRAMLYDGTVLYGSIGHLAALLAPPELTPAVVVAYRLGHGAAREKVRLHRHLLGYTTSSGRQVPGIIQPPGRRLGPGVLLIPASDRSAVVRTLQEAGAVFSEQQAWVPRE
ncbi:MAG: nucleotidyltransferase domain-containing protein [Chloroflexi bacterium]|nr:nucleotidyltransferase domain-containing protein [Chloroflexota bacterium]